MKHYLLVAIAACLALCAGCTDAQIARAQQAVDVTTQRLEQAQQAEAAAKTALEAAQALADSTHSVEAQHAVAVAKAAVDTASQARLAAVETSKLAAQSLEAVKSAQAAGGGAVDLILAAVGAFLPGAGAALVAIRRAVSAGMAFKQTVAGLDAARQSMGNTVWDQHVAPHLAAAQDDSVKAAVKQVQAAA